MSRVAFNDAGLDGVGENTAEETNGARSRSSAASDDGLSAQLFCFYRNPRLSGRDFFEDLVDVGFGEILDPERPTLRQLGMREGGLSTYRQVVRGSTAVTRSGSAFQADNSKLDWPKKFASVFSRVRPMKSQAPPSGERDRTNSQISVENRAVEWSG